MAALCRVDAFSVVTSAIAGVAFEVYVCDLTATHRVAVRQGGDGLSADLTVETCEYHADYLSGVEGFAYSTPLVAASP